MAQVEPNKTNAASQMAEVSYTSLIAYNGSIELANAAKHQTRAPAKVESMSASVNVEVQSTAGHRAFEATNMPHGDIQTKKRSDEAKAQDMLPGILVGLGARLEDNGDRHGIRYAETAIDGGDPCGTEFEMGK